MRATPALHLLSLLTLGASLAAQPVAPPPPAELARAVQQRYDRLADFRTDFVHVYEGGPLGRKATERGRLAVKRPGRMRSIYTAPEKKEFVSDGTHLYSYVPEDRQVVVSRIPPGDEPGSAVMLLAGKGSLLRDFTVSASDWAGRPAGTWALKAVPVASQADYEWLVIVVDAATLQFRMLVTADAQGGQSAFTFSNVRENRGIADSEFVFRVPRGVEVITDGGRQR